MSEISSTDTIIAVCDRGPHIIGSGFENSEEVEEYIESYLRSAQWTYGTITEHGELDTTSEPVTREFTKTETEYYSQIQEQIEDSSEIEQLTSFEKPPYHAPTSAKLFGSRIQYSVQDLDFALHLHPEKWNNSDMSDKSKLESLFYDIVGDNATYLGYSEGYRQRGQRDPYLILFGQFTNTTEKRSQISCALNSHPDIIDSYLTADNVMFAPLYQITDSSTSDIDAIAILDYTGTDVDRISPQNKSRSEEVIDSIEDSCDVQISWMGHVSYYKSYDNIALGITCNE